MSDIVDRIRSVTAYENMAIMPASWATEAASEIERQRAVVDAARGIDWATLNALERALIAAKALGGEP